MAIYLKDDPPKKIPEAALQIAGLSSVAKALEEDPTTALTRKVLSQLGESPTEILPEEVYKNQYGSDWEKVKTAVVARNPKFSNFLKRPISVVANPREKSKGEYIESSNTLSINPNLDKVAPELIPEVVPHEVRHASQFQASAKNEPGWQKKRLVETDTVGRPVMLVPSFSGSMHNDTELFSYGMGVVDKANALRASRGEDRFLPSVSGKPVQTAIDAMQYYIDSLKGRGDKSSQYELKRAIPILDAYKAGIKNPDVQSRLKFMLERYAEGPKVSIKDNAYQVT